MNQPETVFTELLKSYQETAYAKNLEAHLGLYGKDVLLFDLWEDWSLRGQDRLRSMVKEWFESLGSERVVVEYDDLAAQGNAEMIAGTAILKYSAVSADGKTLRFLQNRLTWVLKSEATGWKIIHQHTSSPIGGDMKAILQRKP